MILRAACASLLAVVAPAAPTTLVAPATGTGVYDFELRRIADGIYVAVRPDVFRQPVEGNLRCGQTELTMGSDHSTLRACRRSPSPSSRRRAWPCSRA